MSNRTNSIDPALTETKRRDQTRGQPPRALTVSNQNEKVTQTNKKRQSLQPHRPPLLNPPSPLIQPIQIHVHSLSRSSCHRMLLKIRQIGRRSARSSSSRDQLPLKSTSAQTSDPVGERGSGLVVDSRASTGENGQSGKDLHGK